MIRCKFVGMITIEGDLDEKDLAPFSEVVETWKNVSQHLEETIKDELGDEFTVYVDELNNDISREAKKG